jgi:hypothetical protein
MYKTFRAKKDGCVKVVLKPGVLRQRPAVGRVDQLQELGDELDIDQAAGRQLQVPDALARPLLLHQVAHFQHVDGGLHRIARPAQGRLDRRLGAGLEGRRAGPHHPGAGQGQQLPGLGLAGVIVLEGREADRHRPLGARGPQLHVDLIERRPPPVGADRAAIRRWVKRA